MCVLPATSKRTLAKATMIQRGAPALHGVVDEVAVQRPRSSAASSVCSFNTPSMALKSTAEPSLETGWCNGTQKIAKHVFNQVKKSRYKHKAARAEEFPRFLSISLGGCGFTQSELIATEKCVLCESSTRLASEQRRRRYRSWQTPVVDSRRRLVFRNDTKPAHRD